MKEHHGIWTKEFIMVFVMSLFSSTAAYMTYPLITQYALSIRNDIGLASTIAGLMSLMGLLISPFAGMITDSFNIKKGLTVFLSVLRVYSAVPHPGHQHPAFDHHASAGRHLLCRQLRCRYRLFHALHRSRKDGGRTGLCSTCQYPGAGHRSRPGSLSGRIVGLLFDLLCRCHVRSRLFTYCHLTSLYAGEEAAFFFP